ncbi:MAG TPA: NADP-dependent oxidoreductase [Hellea balneolensis]|uniref:NADP-dependent oxidoreductase n=1 Tax=Hellea balneolensis TaxID=287478 RepID=A0A7V5NX24_9PROT|nr:NADP-dependent oxidoreductase [Hellea balneolensis]
MATNTQIILARRPDGVPEPSDFSVRKAPMPQAGEGEILCQTEYLSLDPYMRGQISGRHISGALAIGDVMRGETISTVVSSNHPDFAPGDRIKHFGGWQAFSLAKGEDAQKLDPRISPPALSPSLGLGALGMPGLTAYAGFACMAEPKPGDTVLVSAASGAVGSMVGQLARLNGCRVIGMAGQKRKIDWLIEKAGLDTCFNYRDEEAGDAIRRLCPNGVDIYFDNVGGQLLERAMENLAIGARVILCGLMAQYNTDTPPPGPNPGLIIRARAIVRGLVVYDHFDKMTEFLDRVIPLVQSGQIKTLEDITDGLENAPEAFCRLMRGENFGKTIIRV